MVPNFFNKQLQMVFATTLALVLTACGGGGGDDTPTTTPETPSTTPTVPTTEQTLTVKVAKKYDISNADSLYIIDENSSTNPAIRRGFSDIAGIEIFIKKMKSTNTVEKPVEVEKVEVTYEDVELNSTQAATYTAPSLYPYDIINTDENYLISRYNDGLNEYGNQSYPDTTYIVKKSDGSISKNIGRIEENGFGDDAIGDGLGNFFGLRADDGSIYNSLYLFWLENDGNVNGTKISYEGDKVSSFIVDKLGNVLYYGLTGDYGNTKAIGRYRDINGTFYNLPESLYSIQPYAFVDYNGFMVLAYVDTNVNWKTVIVDVFNNNYFDYNSTTAIDGRIEYIKKVKNKKTIVAKVNTGQYYSDISVVRSETFAIVNIDARDNYNLSSVSLLESSDNYFYLCGDDKTTNKNTLLKVEPENLSYTTLTSGDYNITSLSVTTNDIVTFEGIRLSDNKKVLGEISSNGTINIADEIENKKILSLEAISN